MTQEAKKVTVDKKEEIEKRLEMEGLLKQAYNSFKDVVNSKISVERNMVNHLLFKAQGIVFITSIKAQFIVGAEAGSGVIITYDESAKGWSGPCAVGLGGLALGLEIAASQIEHIIVLRDKKAVEAFITANQFTLSGSAIAVVGKGSEASAQFALSDKMKSAFILTYSQASGVSLGVSLDGQIIKCRETCNKDFYGKSVKPQEIFHSQVGKIKNDDYSAICQLLDEHVNKDPNETEEKDKHLNETEEKDKHLNETEKDKHLNETEKDKYPNETENKDKCPNETENKDKYPNKIQTSQ